MRIPGFTAEASLDRTSQAYLMALTPATADEVVPQWCYTNPGSRLTTCCYCDSGYCFCYTHHLVAAVPGA